MKLSDSQIEDIETMSDEQYAEKYQPSGMGAFVVTVVAVTCLFCLIVWAFVTIANGGGQ